MIKYIIVILDHASESFCYYKPGKVTGKSGLISQTNLKKIINFAADKELLINYLYSKNKLPPEYKNLIDTSNHIKMVPLELREEYPRGIYLADNTNYHLLEQLHNNNTQNIILRLKKQQLKGLERIVRRMLGKFKRLNLVLPDILSYKEQEITLYKNQLEKIANIVITEYQKGNAYEMSFLSDRILLNRMNNCNAGIDHITFGPNGKYYLCPGFYYKDINGTAAFSEDECIIKNDASLYLKNAPICSLCDCYQCKRCVFLNKEGTLQLNTPSREQCVLSHHERNMSRYILNTLHKMKDFKDFNSIPPIPEINYIDPFQLFIGQKEDNSRKSKKDGPVIPDTIVVKKDGKEVKLPELQVPPASHKDKIIEQKKRVVKNNKKPADITLEDFKTLSTRDMLIELFKIIKSMKSP